MMLMGLDMIVGITRNYCWVTCYYVPEDMRLLLGNREIDSLSRRLRCEAGRKRVSMGIRAVQWNTNERVGPKLRRLSSVGKVRRPIWGEQPH